MAASQEMRRLWRQWSSKRARKLMMQGSQCTWELWLQNVMGLKDSQYLSLQLMIKAQHCAHGDRHDPTNPFQGEVVMLNLPGDVSAVSAVPISPSPFMFGGGGHLTDTSGDKQIPTIMQAINDVYSSSAPARVPMSGTERVKDVRAPIQRPIVFLLLRLSSSEEEEEEVNPTTSQLFGRFLRPCRRLLIFTLRLAHQFEFLCQGPNAYSLTNLLLSC